MDAQPKTLKLATPTEREIVITRDFDAPRDLVFECFTKPELLKRWLGVHNGWVLAVCEIDLRVGGAYRYLWRGPGKTEMGMGGKYLEIVRPERLVSTEKFDAAWYPGGAVGTLTLAERSGRTLATTSLLYESKEARDAVLKSPMDQGMEAGYAALDALLAALGSDAGGRKAG
ncbi:MAG TPA: SRPBCC family protein [Fibrobacteria bacterium]|nr:SRPBCC family protein [Fibrobacteria bacterium]